MTVVFVHGNPETPAVWDLLSERLRERGYDDQVRLTPPGFGAPVPPDFGCTVGEYREWLIVELEQFGQPVDLVGHDWGGGHTVNVAMSRPDLLHSWCSDAIGLFDPDYVWHDLAQIWQTPGAGEDFIAGMAAQGARQRAEETYIPRGMDPSIARVVAEGFDESMQSAILPLYRSATQPVMRQLGAGLEAAAARPGLVVMASEDHLVGTDQQRRRSAARAGAQVAVLDGLDHWWMTQDADAGAGALDTFWSSLSSTS